MLFSPKSLLAALEGAIVTGLSAFAGSLTLTSGTVTVKTAVAGLIGGGIAALYSLTKNLGAIQAGATPPASTVAPIVSAPPVVPAAPVAPPAAAV